MSMVLTRSPLEIIGMNSAGAQKRRSARLSHEENGEEEPPSKKSRTTGANAVAAAGSTKQPKATSKAKGSKKTKVYDEEADGFAFTKGKRKKAPKDADAPEGAEAQPVQQAMLPPPPQTKKFDVPITAPIDANATKVQKKTRRKLPSTPERDVPEKTTRRSKRGSSEMENVEAAPSPQQEQRGRRKPNAERSPSAEGAQPLTVEKKRTQGSGVVEEEKVMRIMLPFADTPIIRKNRAMRKASAENHRRSSSGMRGRRASSLIDEGRGHALPHSEVPTSEFYKHISADLTEPRRMRCLLGWCGTRALLPSSDSVQSSNAAESSEAKARAIARTIQEDLSSELVTNGFFSDWFSRDESTPPQLPVRKRPNPRNLANAAKVEELTLELQKLERERLEWDELVKSSAGSSHQEPTEAETCLSPLRADLLDSPQRAIFDQLQASKTSDLTDTKTIQSRLQEISKDLEFAVDQFAHGVHTLQVARETAERVADHSLADAANALEDRQKQRAAAGKPVHQMDALRGLARVLNAKHK
ncbi:uncharacterized protein K489DRAFT_379747 [Dissoconium aciculare CBS 342.82]|uniref:Mis12-Mtw1 protein n=1 Tax=Dissoconium aciculare CBS 342.82 TaxID=1314786 RepID=A0A6J3M788_9PEZI|nr:uncharacterized protein K489DRAFT_379747 [Dissoconium aciculare CBS 342.82]KAF1823753.1 hypothetical protein K489DRAFT_379747 [Dissoconium aciculare CBS 342.82]